MGVLSSIVFLLCVVYVKRWGRPRRRPMASYGESRGDTVVKEFLKHICGLCGVSVSCDCVVHSGYRVDMSLNLSKSAYVCVTEMIFFSGWLLVSRLEVLDNNAQKELNSIFKTGAAGQITIFRFWFLLLGSMRVTGSS